MIDLKSLREHPQRFIDGASAKKIEVDIALFLQLDEQKRSLTRQREELRAAQKRISKEIGPQIGSLKGQLKSANEEERAEIESILAEFEAQPPALKSEIQTIDDAIAELEPSWSSLLLQIPQPPDSDVPIGQSSEDNLQLSTWSPDGYDLSKSFVSNRCFEPKSHLELVKELGLADFERGVKMAGTRHYILTGNGMRLQQAVLRFAFD